MHIDRTWLAAILIAAIGLHAVPFLTYLPGDVLYFVQPWLLELRANGFSEPVGNYAPPYLYLLWVLTMFGLPTVLLVKMLSVAGAGWLALASGRLLQALGKPPELGLITLMLPSVIFNTSMLGQADTFWLAPCVLAVAAAVRGKHVQVAAWAGLAFAVKAQAAWIAPFVVYYLVVSRARPTAWLAAPVALVAAWLPAWLAGWSLTDLIMVYPEQVMWRREGEETFVGNGASLWTTFGYLSLETAYRLRWIAYLLTIFAVAIYWQLLPEKLTPKRIVIAAALSALIVPFFLPLMHERFFMLADVLVFVLALAFSSRRIVLAAVVMQVASALPVLVWASQLQPWEQVAPFLAVAVIVLLARWPHDHDRLVVSRASGGISEVGGGGAARA